MDNFNLIFYGVIALFFGIIIYRFGKNLGKAIAFIIDLIKNPEFMDNISEAIKNSQNKKKQE